MKRLARSCYEGARNGSGRTDPTPAALPWAAAQGGALLSERREINSVGLDKGGKAQRIPSLPCDDRADDAALILDWRFWTKVKNFCIGS